MYCRDLDILSDVYRITVRGAGRRDRPVRWTCSFVSLIRPSINRGNNNQQINGQKQPFLRPEVFFRGVGKAGWGVLSYSLRARALTRQTRHLPTINTTTPAIMDDDAVVPTSENNKTHHNNSTAADDAVVVVTPPPLANNKAGRRLLPHLKGTRQRRCGGCRAALAACCRQFKMWANFIHSLIDRRHRTRSV
jgi:hypothetical protein